MDEGLSIGDVAARTGVAPSALRFYEEQGLVEADRSPGGQRRFGRDVIRRVSFIRAAQRVGLSLDEIRTALEQLPHARTPTRADWEVMASEWGPWLDRRIAELEALRTQLASCIGCGCLSLDTCALYNPADRAARLGTGPRYLLGDSAADVLRSDQS